MTATVLFGALIVFLALGVPVAFAIGVATLAAMFVQGIPALAIAQKILTGVDSFPLLAMPSTNCCTHAGSSLMMSSRTTSTHEMKFGQTSFA